MRMAVEIIIGAVFATGLLAYVRTLSLKGASRVLGISLLLAALIYVGFAVYGLGVGTADSSWLGVEIGGLVFYGAFAYLGIRKSAWHLVIGWLLHVMWDTVIHGEAAFVPGFYPGVCIGFDVAVAVYAIYLLNKTNGS